MEINIKTSGFGLGDYTMNASFSMEPGGTVSVTPSEPEQETLSPLDEIQDYLNAIKEVFFSPEYDDKTMGFVIEDYIIAIQEVLDAN
jgi:hypothetical protein